MRLAVPSRRPGRSWLVVGLLCGGLASAPGCSGTLRGGLLGEEGASDGGPGSIGVADGRTTGRADLRAPADLAARDGSPRRNPSDAAPAKRRLTVTEIVGGAYSVVQPYGYTTFNGGYEYCQGYGHWDASRIVHCGSDITLARGTKLYAMEDATVTESGGTGYFADSQNAAAGELRMRLSDGTEVIYGHCSRILVTTGARVTLGQEVAESGTQNGPHLHLEVRRPDKTCTYKACTVDPITFFGP
ncbi:MAG: M23 family metallopeptidase [Deltaproteobacteria bacterium]|nr:M23 family metallopeptidase [Deltaproteobacteria bacterium]